MVLGLSAKTDQTSSKQSNGAGFWRGAMELLMSFCFHVLWYFLTHKRFGKHICLIL